MGDRHAGQCWGGADTPDERDREADEAPSDCVLSDKGCRDGEPACNASYAEGCGAYVSKEATMSDDIIDYDPQDFPEAVAWFKEARARHRRKCEIVADLKAIIGRQEEELHQAELRVRELEAEVAALRDSRDRWRYLAEKATWCFKEGMFLCGNGHSRSGSWWPAQVITRWNQRMRDARLPQCAREARP